MGRAIQWQNAPPVGLAARFCNAGAAGEFNLLELRAPSDRGCWILGLGSAGPARLQVGDATFIDGVDGGAVTVTTAGSQAPTAAVREGAAVAIQADAWRLLNSSTAPSPTGWLPFPIYLAAGRFLALVVETADTTQNLFLAWAEEIP